MVGVNLTHSRQGSAWMLDLIRWPDRWRSAIPIYEIVIKEEVLDEEECD